MDSALLSIEQQREKLRRFVDEWRSRASSKLQQIDGEILASVPNDRGDLNADPLHLSTEPKESASLLSFADTNNVLFNKLITVLAYDCLEIERLCRQAYKRFYPQLLTFGLSSGPEEVLVEGEPQKMFGQSLLNFYELSEFLARLRAVLSNLVRQLEAIYPGDSRDRIYASFTNVHLQTAVSSLARGCGILLTFDEIVRKNASIGHAMSLFLRMLHTIRSEPSKFSTKAEHVESLHNAVTEMDEIFQVGLFQRCLREDFFGHPGMVKLKSNGPCLDEISLCLHEGLQHILSRLDTLKERPSDRVQLVGLLGVFVFHSWMSVECPEKKVGKAIVEVLRRAPVLHIYSCIKLLPLDFLMAHLPPWVLSWPVLKEARKEAGVIRSNYLTSLDDALVREMQWLKRALANWVVSFDSMISPMLQRWAMQTMLRTQMRQLLQGLYLANRVRHILRATLDLHAALEVPIRKEKLIHLCHAAALLKAVENVYHRKGSDTAQSIFHIIHFMQAQITKRLLPLKAQLETDLSGKSRGSSLSLLSLSLTRSGKDMDTKLLDSLASVTLLLKMLKGNGSEKRRIVLNLAFDVLSSIKTGLQDEDRVKISTLLSEMELAVEVNALVENITDCSFLYWRKEMMLTWFGIMYAQAGKPLQLQFLINAFNDGVKLLKRGSNEQIAIAAYEQEMEDALNEEVVGPLCRDIETDLRLHVHSAHLKGAVTVNPTKTGVRDLSWFFHLRPLRLPSKYICIKTRVETYLNAAFYNHAAMALHNWKTYCEMKHLAEQKYGLELDDIHLPGQTLEQGVDILEIMRNIHIFAACYTYNLNTQVFIERVSNARDRKYLNTIGVKHVANSIRTHGTGIMSTTVNFTYQFLAQKFVVFSQFLFDDHIKSRLVKEQRFWKDCRGQSKAYPVARAEKLNKDIKKLGLTDDGSSFLDQFRQLVAEMGNALGFVRMVRLGGLHHSSAASGFVHNVVRKLNFEEVARDLGMHPEALQAGKILDRTFESLEMRVEQTNYFSILTGVFEQELQSNDNLHLRDFFLILPALIVNGVEAMLQAKDKLSKRGRGTTSASFTDDGLALGIAYILKVLGQDKQFDSLHWFDSARRHYENEKARLKDGLDMDNIGGGMNGLQVWSQKLASLSEEDAQNMQLAMKRLSSYVMELELMEYTFSAARIFFQ